MGRKKTYMCRKCNVPRKGHLCPYAGDPAPGQMMHDDDPMQDGGGDGPGLCRQCSSSHVVAIDQHGEPLSGDAKQRVQGRASFKCLQCGTTWQKNMKVYMCLRCGVPKRGHVCPAEGVDGAGGTDVGRRLRVSWMADGQLASADGALMSEEGGLTQIRYDEGEERWYRLNRAAMTLGDDGARFEWLDGVVGGANHEPRQTFLCPVPGCHKVYQTPSGLYQHKRTVHGIGPTGRSPVLPGGPGYPTQSALPGGLMWVQDAVPRHNDPAGAGHYVLPDGTPVPYEQASVAATAANAVAAANAAVSGAATMREFDRRVADGSSGHMAPPAQPGVWNGVGQPPMAMSWSDGSQMLQPNVPQFCCKRCFGKKEAKAAKCKMPCPGAPSAAAFGGQGDPHGGMRPPQMYGMQYAAAPAHAGSLLYDVALPTEGGDASVTVTAAANAVAAAGAAAAAAAAYVGSASTAAAMVAAMAAADAKTPADAAAALNAAKDAASDAEAAGAAAQAAANIGQVGAAAQATAAKVLADNDKLSSAVAYERAETAQRTATATATAATAAAAAAQAAGRMADMAVTRLQGADMQPEAEEDANWDNQQGQQGQPVEGYEVEAAAGPVEPVGGAELSPAGGQAARNLLPGKVAGGAAALFSAAAAAEEVEVEADAAADIAGQKRKAGDAGAQLSVGMRVQARWQGQRSWYAGTIMHVNLDDGSAGVAYDDGDTEDRVVRKFIRVERETGDAAARAPKKPKGGGSGSSPPKELPEGWEIVMKGVEGNMYKRYHGPNGAQAQSIKQAWQVHDEQHGIVSGGIVSGGIVEVEEVEPGDDEATGEVVHGEV